MATPEQDTYHVMKGEDAELQDVSVSGDLNVTGTATFSGAHVHAGDLTGATVNATGDTSASDNAAMGYTAAEGLILTGQGSTNDVTIKNDADAEVMGVLTGTTTADFKGIVTATTFEPDGDTAAADNAAIGYAAADGIVITGQGSTNDITLRNDADAEVMGVPTGTTNAIFPGNVQQHGNEAITATADGTGTGLITANSRFVTATSDTGTKQISLPAAVVGDEIDILVLGAACELISAVAGHQVNQVTVGATNELALTQDSLYTCRYVAANNWIVRGFTKLGADEGALVPDGL